jgi:hypothetical protein
MYVITLTKLDFTTSVNPFDLQKVVVHDIATSRQPRFFVVGKVISRDIVYLLAQFLKKVHDLLDDVARVFPFCGPTLCPSLNMQVLALQ